MLNSFNDFIISAVFAVAVYCFFSRKPEVSLEHYSNNQLMLFCFLISNSRKLLSAYNAQSFDDPPPTIIIFFCLTFTHYFNSIIA